MRGAPQQERCTAAFIACKTFQCFHKAASSPSLYPLHPILQNGATHLNVCLYTVCTGRQLSGYNPRRCWKNWKWREKGILFLNSLLQHSNFNFFFFIFFYLSIYIYITNIFQNRIFQSCYYFSLSRGNYSCNPIRTSRHIQETYLFIKIWYRSK